MRLAVGLGAELERPRPRPRPRPPRRPPPAVRERREEGNTRGQVERSGRGAPLRAREGSRERERGAFRKRTTRMARSAARRCRSRPRTSPPRLRRGLGAPAFGDDLDREIAPDAEMGVAATRRGDANAPTRAANARGATTWRGGDVIANAIAFRARSCEETREGTAAAVCLWRSLDSARALVHAERCQAMRG